MQAHDDVMQVLTTSQYFLELMPLTFDAMIADSQIWLIVRSNLLVTLTVTNLHVINYIDLLSLTYIVKAN